MKQICLVLAFSINTISFAQSTVYPGASWDKKAPSEVGFDTAKFNEAISYIKGQMELSRFTVVRRGYLVYSGSKSKTRQSTWSVTKSFTSTVMGLLVDAGTIRRDSLVADYVSNMKSQYPRATFEHFTTQTSGYKAKGNDVKNPFTPAKPASAPGAKFHYDDVAMNQFGNLLTQAAKQSLSSLFKTKIADKIGMKNWQWKTLAKVNGKTVNGGAGRTSSGMDIDAEDFARFCYLFLRKGNWKGEQLLSEDWISRATSVQVPTTKPGDKSGPGIYGFNWWVKGTKPDGTKQWPTAPNGTYGALGFNTNFCLVIPEWDLVVTRLGTDGNNFNAVDPFITKIGQAIRN